MISMENFEKRSLTMTPERPSIGNFSPMRTTRPDGKQQSSPPLKMASFIMLNSQSTTHLGTYRS